MRLAATEQGTGFPVLLLHGFPELGYSWRHQLPALAAAGYRAIAPDMRGYGGSPGPERIEDYDVHHLSADVVELMDDLGLERAAVVGHDWGAVVAWHLALTRPDRVAGVCGMSVPFTPRASRRPTEIWRERFAGRFFYILHFQELGIADAELAADPARTMRGMLCGLTTGDGTALIGAEEELADPTMSGGDGRGVVERLPQPAELPAWLTQAELDHYVAEFTRTGFTGGVNWYRNFDRNWETTPELAGAHVTIPSLFVAGDRDPVLLMSPPGRQAEYLDDLRGQVLVPGAGHWVQQERPDEVNAALLAFLEAL
ncbi:epoxide hydrolase EphA [Pseudonocardia ailaonensis]|uniref:Epoxide hydrolase EphA n=1 Tax=Pseudonocardia ailaonensis TaxID=367279 RepID=A0ABN2NNH1_9PSEU